MPRDERRTDMNIGASGMGVLMNVLRLVPVGYATRVKLGRVEFKNSREKSATLPCETRAMFLRMPSPRAMGHLR